MATIDLIWEIREWIGAVETNLKKLYFIASKEGERWGWGLKVEEGE
jgi:hypothetical protein